MIDDSTGKNGMISDEILLEAAADLFNPNRRIGI